VHGNSECLKMAVGHQEFSTSFAHAIKHAAEDGLEEDLLEVTATTLEEELAPPCLYDVADYFGLVEEEVVFQDLEQEAKPETSLVELK
jgi:putative NADPH-quinone reductase